MGTKLQQRRLEDVQRQLVRARESARVLEEQIVVWQESCEDLRIRALVSETPLVSAEYKDVARQLEVASNELARRHDDVAALQKLRDELLRDWEPKE
jgi:hypothetical protein